MTNDPLDPQAHAKTSLLRYAAEYARQRGYRFVVAGCWPDPIEALADALGCSVETAVHVALCRAPAAAELDAWTTTIAKHFGLDASRVRQVGERLIGEG